MCAVGRIVATFARTEHDLATYGAVSAYLTQECPTLTRASQALHLAHDHTRHSNISHKVRTQAVTPAAIAWLSRGLRVAEAVPCNAAGVLPACKGMGAAPDTHIRRFVASHGLCSWHESVCARTPTPWEGPEPTEDFRALHRGWEG